jgi:hypothetical protein
MMQNVWTIPRSVLAVIAGIHALFMAILQELLIVILIFNPPHPVPPWMWVLTLFITPLAIISGG